MTLMIQLLTLAISATITASASATETSTRMQCQVPDMVSYTIHNHLNDSQIVLNLVRQDNWVAHEYPSTNITEAWELNAAGGIKPTRFFDLHQRAIEYQPNERVHGKAEKDWSYRYQLVSDTLLAKATKVDAKGEGCEHTVTLKYSADAKNYLILYLPYKKTVREFQVTDFNQQVIEHWVATITPVETHFANNFIASRRDYRAEDFADIGDVHNDPFLDKMTTIGFIEAGASGFYQTDDQGHTHSLGTHSH